MEESKKSPKASGAARQTLESHTETRQTSASKHAQTKSEVVGQATWHVWLTSGNLVFPIVLVHIVSQQISIIHFRF